MADKSSSWLKWIIILVLVGGLIGGGVWYYLGKKDSAPEYQTASISRGDLAQLVTATGQLSPVINVQVGSQISGRIKAIYVDFNAEVSSNQVIAQIDPSTYQIGVLRAQAQLSNAVANLALARVQAGRADVLFKSKLIPAADYDTAVAQLLQADAGVQTAEANLESAEVDLSRCTIVAPVEGVVISRNVDVGQTVAASFNTPTLFLIANDLSKMQIAAMISEADIGGVATNQAVNFTVDAYPYRTFHGRVSQLRYGPVTNQNVVNYNAIIEVNNDDLKLYPGMTANVSIIVAERENTLKVPNAALRFRPPEKAVADSKTSKTNAPVQMADRGPRSAGMPGMGGPGGPGGGRGDGPRRGGAGGGNRGGGSGAGRADRPTQRTIYVLKAGANAEQPELEPLTIRTGINDGVSTEIIDGLKEGDEVVTGVVIQDPVPAGGPASSPFGGGGGGGRRGFR